MHTAPLPYLIKAGNFQQLDHRVVLVLEEEGRKSTDEVENSVVGLGNSEKLVKMYLFRDFLLHNQKLYTVLKCIYPS